MTKFTRLVAYGCSYTQGDEILDETYIPGAEDLKRTQGRNAFWIAFGKKYPELRRASYNELNKLHAWPQHLADKIGLPCVNCAYPGNSIHNIIYNIERDLANGNILDTDLVILGIPSSYRVGYIDNLGGDKTLQLGHVDSWPDEFKKGYSYFINWYNDPTITFYFSVALRALLGMAQTRLKNQLYFAECDPGAMHLEGYIEPPMHPSVVKTLELAYSDFKQSGLMISDCSLYSQAHPDEWKLAGGHLAEPAHAQWSEHLYQNCQRMGLTR
jgi:hypothetical protein